MTEYWPWIATIIIVILILNNVRLKHKQKSNSETNKGRTPTAEELKFINKAMEDYHANIMIVLSFGSTTIGSYRNQVLLSNDDEVIVQIEILYKDIPLLVNCYFSGKCEMFYKKQETEFHGFSIDNITQGLKNLGIENIGLPSSVTSLHA